MLIVTALDARNKYLPLHASEACAMLANTERQCVENCEMLKLVGLPCGRSGPNKNIGGPTEEMSTGLGTGGVAGIAVVVIVLLIAVLVGGIFYYRRKYKGAKVNNGNKIKMKINGNFSGNPHSGSSLPLFPDRTGI